MKSIFLICFLHLCSIVAYTQIELTINLADSIIYNLEECRPNNHFLNYRLILKFVSLPNQKNSIYYTSTAITNRKDIPEDAMIYMNDKDLYFVLIKNVKMDNYLQERLIPYFDVRFNQVLDSIEFRYSSLSGVVVERSPLILYKIKRSFPFRDTYKISSRIFIPYLSAPEMFLPLQIATDGALSKKIEPWYYDYLGRLNEKYYEDMKPKEKIVIRMQKNKK